MLIQFKASASEVLTCRLTVLASYKELGVVVDIAWRGKRKGFFSGYTAGGVGSCSWPEGLTPLQMPQFKDKA